MNIALVHADEVPVDGLTIADLDEAYFTAFFERNFHENLDPNTTPLASLLRTMNLLKGETLNLAGALLFAKNPSFKLPLFIVKAISYPGNAVNPDDYLESRDITGNITTQYQQSLNFISGNIRHVQNGQNVNSLGVWEIPRICLEELLVNALIHREYFVPAPIRIFIFSDRIELISPGHLPNNLTVENIKRGNSNIRNPILASFATRILPYRGLGQGVMRALAEYPHVNFEDDYDGNLFRVTIQRPPAP